MTGKTVSVTRKMDGAQWKTYFGADGKTLMSDNKVGTWEVNSNGQHYNSGVKLKCATGGRDVCALEAQWRRGGDLDQDC